MLENKEIIPYIIAVDFDGTLCEDNFPNIGNPKEDVIRWVKNQRKGLGYNTKIILWTCRNGKYLEEAIEWCKNHGLEFDAVNENLKEVENLYGGYTRKVFADLYVDDKNIELYCLERTNTKRGGLVCLLKQLFNRQ